jgi:hypothetical protein
MTLDGLTLRLLYTCQSSKTTRKTLFHFHQEYILLRLNGSTKLNWEFKEDKIDTKLALLLADLNKNMASIFKKLLLLQFVGSPFA